MAVRQPIVVSIVSMSLWPGGMLQQLLGGLCLLTSEGLLTEPDGA